MNLVLIGFGAIGSAVLQSLAGDEGVRVVAIVARPGGPGARAAASLAPGVPVVAGVPLAGVDLVVEAAGHEAIEAHVLPARLDAAARRGGASVQLIAGAIGAIDALSAAHVGGLDRVRYTGRKRPGAWTGTPAAEHIDLLGLTVEAVLFEGSGRDAARLYPKNANVAATVALAGLGLDKTQVRLIADPGVTQNVHVVEASGGFGQLELTLRNAPLPGNPKTSALTVYSAVRAIRNRVAAIRF
jgi:aspartate dehydrogenase